MNDIIRMESVHLSMGGAGILDDISCSIKEGKTTVFIGPSGCGKSCLLKTFAGILFPRKGHVFVNGRDYKDFREKENVRFRKDLGFVFQDAALWSNLSVLDNLKLPLLFHFPEKTEEEIDEKIYALVEKIKFGDDLMLRPAMLSVGKQKMIGFLRGIINDPSILILDSPTMGTDTSISRSIENMILEYKEKGKTILLASQNNDLISRITDFMVVLDKGRVIEQGLFPEILNSGNNRMKEIFKDIAGYRSNEVKDYRDLL